jgi:hypothetical protein
VTTDDPVALAAENVELRRRMQARTRRVRACIDHGMERERELFRAALVRLEDENRRLRGMIREAGGRMIDATLSEAENGTEGGENADKE